MVDDRKVLLDSVEAIFGQESRDDEVLERVLHQFDFGQQVIAEQRADWSRKCGNGRGEKSRAGLVADCAGLAEYRCAPSELLFLENIFVETLAGHVATQICFSSAACAVP